MKSSQSGASRIIPLFGKALGRARFRSTALALLALGVAAASAQAQTGYQVQIALDLEGQKYEVPMSPLPSGERVEVPVTPSGLRTYARVIPLQGVSGQAMLDLQIYEPAGGKNQKQVASVTIPSFLGTENSAELSTIKGKLLIQAYLNTSDAPLPASPGSGPVQPSSPEPSFTAPKGFDQPMSAPKPLAGSAP